MERLNKVDSRGQKGSKINLTKSTKFEKVKKDKKNEDEKTVKDKKVDSNEIAEFYEEDPDEIKFILSDENAQFPRVKSATINKLIERLTHEVYPGIIFILIF